MDIFLRILDASLLPFAVGFATVWTNRAISNRSLAKEYVELAFRILQNEEVKQKSPKIYNFAFSILNKYSPVTVPDDLAVQITKYRGIPVVRNELVIFDEEICLSEVTTCVISAVNQGLGVDTNIAISLTLPSGLEFVSASGATNVTSTGPTIRYAPLPSLAPKAKATWQVVVRGKSVGLQKVGSQLTSDGSSIPHNTTAMCYCSESRSK